MSKLLEAFLASNASYPVLYSQLTELIGEAAHLPPPAREAGSPLRLLFAGYAGGGNTGSDVRVAEMIRQVRAILGRDRVEIGLVGTGVDLPEDLQDDVKLELVQDYFPEFLIRTIREYDGVIACDGSMFKSNLCCMLSAMLGGALGMAVASGRLAVGYGAEAGKMEPELAAFIASLGSGPLILCRNEESKAVLQPLGLRATGGADTAWTYQSEPTDSIRERLVRLGLADFPLLAVCPMNPFWWPVKPDLVKAQEMAETGAHSELFFGSILFHPDNESIRSRYAAYLDALAHAAKQWQQDTGGGVLIIGMDKVDRAACNDLAARFEQAPPIVASGDMPPRAIVGLLRAADLLLSSRFHAIVTSMEAGVPAVGVSMDERIANLLGKDEIGRRLLKVDAPDLADKLVDSLRHAEANRLDISRQTRQSVAGHLREMAEMGRRFAQEVRRFHPDIDTPADGAHWTAFLPEISPELQSLIAQHN